MGVFKIFNCLQFLKNSSAKIKSAASSLFDISISSISILTSVYGIVSNIINIADIDNNNQTTAAVLLGSNAAVTGLMVTTLTLQERREKRLMRYANDTHPKILKLLHKQEDVISRTKNKNRLRQRLYDLDSKVLFDEKIWGQI